MFNDVHLFVDIMDCSFFFNLMSINIPATWRSVVVKIQT